MFLKCKLICFKRSIKHTESTGGLQRLPSCSKRVLRWIPRGLGTAESAQPISQPSPQGQTASPLSLFQKAHHTGPQTLTALQQQLSILSVRTYYVSMFGWVDLGTVPKNIFRSRAQRASFSVHSGPADCQNTSLVKYSSE